MRSSTILGLAALWLTLAACRPKEADASTSRIPQAELVDIIAEVLVLEAAVKEAPYPLQDSLHTLTYERVLAQRGYTAADFTAAMKWLQSDPRRMTKGYEQALERLEKMGLEDSGMGNK